MTRYSKIKVKMTAKIPKSEELLKRWARLGEIRRHVNRALEDARKEEGLGQSLAAAVTLSGTPGTVSFLESFGNDLKDIFIVSAVTLKEGPAPEEEGVEVEVAVKPAEGGKCERCWVFTPDVDTDGRFPGTCPRCAGILADRT